MKFIKGLFFSILTVLMIFQMSHIAAQAKTVVLFQEGFNVPGPGKHKEGQAGSGVERPFTLDNQSTVTLTIATNKQKPSLNVTLLDAANYAKYQTSGILTNLTGVAPFTKNDTLAFKTTGELAPGKYVLLVQWSRVGLFYTAPAVGLKMVADEHEAPKPTPTPKGFWSNMFGGGK